MNRKTRRRVAALARRGEATVLVDICECCGEPLDGPPRVDLLTPAERRDFEQWQHVQSERQG
jgi:hypothetical protein